MPRFGKKIGFPKIGGRMMRYCRCPICGYEEEKGTYGKCYRINCPYCHTPMEEY